MKMREMLQICSDHKGICEGCPLNCNKDWFNDLTSWCLVKIREDAIKKYRYYKEQGNDTLAEMVMKEYKKTERKYLNT